MLSLSRDEILQISLKLNIKDRIKLFSASSCFCKLIKDETVWKSFLLHDFPNYGQCLNIRYMSKYVFIYKFFELMNSWEKLTNKINKLVKNK